MQEPHICGEILRNGKAVLHYTHLPSAPHIHPLHCFWKCRGAKGGVCAVNPQPEYQWLAIPGGWVCTYMRIHQGARSYKRLSNHLW